MIKRYSEIQSSEESWFSGSKIVDSKGKPLVLYHGGRKWDELTEGILGAFWATDDPFVADTYAGRYPEKDAEIKPLIMNIKNPLDLRNPNTAKEFFGYDISKGDFSGIEKNMAHNLPKENKEMIDKAKTKGYDGIIHFDTDQYNKGLHTSYVVFDPKQVRFVEDEDFGETETRFRKYSSQIKSSASIYDIPRMPKKTDPQEGKLSFEEFKNKFDDAVHNQKLLILKKVRPNGCKIPSRHPDSFYIVTREPTDNSKWRVTRFIVHNGEEIPAGHEVVSRLTDSDKRWDSVWDVLHSSIDWDKWAQV